jgi:D-beta-D-heptose 7-phosphate kinase/D-beta-D-heptose 1-phosphate adenosyltransferase
MILKEADLVSIRKKYRSKRIVFALGTFDIVHCGHIEYLAWAKSQGDFLIVAVTNDQEVRRRKGPGRPVFTAEDRLSVIDALMYTRYVVLTEGNQVPSYLASIEVAKKLQPDLITLGADWGLAEKPFWAAAFPDTEILLAPARQEGRSTTAALQRALAATKKP